MLVVSNFTCRPHITDYINTNHLYSVYIFMMLHKQIMNTYHIAINLYNKFCMLNLTTVKTYLAKI